MKNKPDPTVLKTSFLSNASVKRTPKSHETIPLNLSGRKGSTSTRDRIQGSREGQG
jgi:hypothetical protein